MDLGSNPSDPTPDCFSLVSGTDSKNQANKSNYLFQDFEFLEEFFGNLSKNKLERISRILTKVYQHKYKKKKDRKYGNMQKGFSEGELQKFFSVINNEKHLLAFKIQAYLGLRVGEVIKVNLADLDFEKRSLKIFTEKAHTGDFLHLHDLIFEPLIQYVRKYQNLISANKGYLFYSDSRKAKTSHISVDSLRNLFRKYARKSNLDESYAEAEDHKNQIRKLNGNNRLLRRLSTHSLRHYFISRTYQNTLDPITTQKLARHQDLSSTQIYIHTSGFKLVENIKKAFEVSGKPMPDEQTNELKEMLSFFKIWKEMKR